MTYKSRKILLGMFSHWNLIFQQLQFKFTTLTALSYFYLRIPSQFVYKLNFLSTQQLKNGENNKIIVLFTVH